MANSSVQMWCDCVDVVRVGQAVAFQMGCVSGVRCVKAVQVG